jgi:hypothetical protein
MLTLMTYLAVTARTRWDDLRRSGDRGAQSAEGVILAAGLVLMALLVIAVFREKITARLQSIDLG